MERKTISQISVFMENRTGQLVEILRILKDAGINLHALNVAETEDYGVLRLIADDSERAISTLSNEGIVATKNEVVAVAVPDRPGGLFELLNMLSSDNVDIEYMYSVFGKTEGKAYMIMAAKDKDYLAESLIKNGIKAIDSSEMSIS